MNSRDGLSTTIGNLLHNNDSIYDACSDITGGAHQFRTNPERLQGIQGFVTGSGYSCHEFLWFLCKEGQKMRVAYPALQSIYGGGDKKNYMYLLTRLNAWVNNNDILYAFVAFKQSQLAIVRLSHDSINASADLSLIGVPEQHRGLLISNNCKDYRMHGLNIYLYHERSIDPLSWFTKYDRELARVFFICNPEYIKLGFALQEALNKNSYNLGDWLKNG